VVIDTSILLAIFLNEDSGSWASAQLEANQPLLRMSVVNYTELLILIADRRPSELGEIRQRVERSVIRLAPATVAQAEIAAAARRRYPLNLGDCFAYALAKDEGCPLLTLDRDFRRCDIQVVLPRTNQR
jgi:ribonuclease VapC